MSREKVLEETLEEYRFDHDGVGPLPPALPITGAEILVLFAVGLIIVGVLFFSGKLIHPYY